MIARVNGGEVQVFIPQERDGRTIYIKVELSRWNIEITESAGVNEVTVREYKITGRVYIDD